MLIRPPLRTTDVHGSGAYGAPRGSRTHNGVDVACWKGSEILSPVRGVITKIGFPYDPTRHPAKVHLRYVELSHGNDIFTRWFYVETRAAVGDMLAPGDVIGVAQGLRDVYAGITDHFHFEVFKRADMATHREYFDPLAYLEDIGHGF